MALRTVGVRLTAEVSSYMSNMRRAGASTKEFVGETKKAADSGHLDHVADRAGAVGIGLAGMAVAAIKSAADFDKSMSAVKAATHASAAEIGQLREAALQAGKDTQYSATGAADAITELSKAGVSTADVLNGGLRGALSLAAAGQMDVGEAAETAASAMVQFKLSGDKIPHVADLLAAGAGKAQGSVHDMGAALNQSGLVASQFGLSIEDTTGALAEFANAGLTGSDAGTSFKTMLLAIANPSSVTAKKMQELGISFYDTQGRFIGLNGVAEMLRLKLGDLTEEQRQATLGQIFGSDAIRSATVLYRDGAAGVEEWKNKVNDSGYASKTAAALTDNLAGDIERLKGSLETMAIEAGGGANGGLRFLVKMLETLVDDFGALPPAVGSTITVLAAVSGAALLAGAGWIKLRKTSADVRAELVAMGPAGERAASGMSRMASAAGKVGAAFAVLEVAGAIVAQFQDDLKPQLDALGVGLEGYATSGKLAGESSRVLGDDLDKLNGTFQILAHDSGKNEWARNLQGGLESIIPGLKGTDTSLARTKERIESIDAALAQMASGGNTQGASDAFQKLASVLATGDVTMEEFRKQFPQYAASLETAGKATTGTAGATGDLKDALAGAEAAQDDYTTATKAAAGAVRGERDALISLADFQRKEIDPVFGLIDAEKTLEKAHKDVAKAVSAHGKNSVEARKATQDLASAAIDLEDNVGKLGGAFDGKMTPALRATLKAAGLTKSEINVLDKSFQDAKKSADKFDDKYEANASAPGAKQAKTDLDKAYTAANNFAGPYMARVDITGDKAVGQKLNRLAAIQQALKQGKAVAVMNAADKKGFGYAAGGWTGPGSKYQEAGVVHADEFVINKESRRKIEARSPGMLDEMNATGQLPGYAGGGRVWPYPVTAAGTRVPSQAEVMSAVTPDFGHWPSSPGAQRGDSGVWHKILALVKGSGIPYEFGNSYRPGDPLWHGSGRAIDFMGYNQDKLANFFMARQSQVLELIHRTKNRDYGITRGHYNAMPHQWPLHRNHLHVAMKNGGTITEPITGVGASGRTYSFGENYQPERVTPNWQGGSGGGATVVNLNFSGPVGSQYELKSWLVGAFDDLKRAGKV
jgi:TP901 family phage tail tape measure protein